MADEQHPGNSANKGNSVGCGSKLAKNIMASLKKNKKVAETNVALNHPWSLKQKKKKKNSDSEFYNYSGLQAHHLIPSSVVHYKTKNQQVDLATRIETLEDSICQLEVEIDRCNELIAKHNRLKNSAPEGSSARATHARNEQNRKNKKVVADTKKEGFEKDLEETRKQLLLNQEAKKGLEQVLEEESQKTDGSAKSQSDGLDDAKRSYNKKWADIFNIIEYDINCAENGVFLPSLTIMACKLHVPLHRGAHDLGFNYDKEGSWATLSEIKNYYKWVEDELAPAEELAEATCDDVSNKKEDILKSVLKVSRDALEKISDFSLTISADGKDYKSGGVGCANKVSISEKLYSERIKKVLESSHKLKELNVSIASLEKEREDQKTTVERRKAIKFELTQKKDQRVIENKKAKELKQAVENSFSRSTKCTSRSHKGDLGGSLDKLEMFEGKLRVADGHIRE